MIKTINSSKNVLFYWGHENLVKLLIEHGADPQLKTPGETSIDLAEMNGIPLESVFYINTAV